MRKITYTKHIYTVDSSTFYQQLIKAINDAQSIGCDVEVQYSTVSEKDGDYNYVVYSALVLGRK